MTFTEWLKRKGACDPGRAWVRRYTNGTLPDVWEKLNNAPYMAWLFCKASHYERYNTLQSQCYAATGISLWMSSEVVDGKSDESSLYSIDDSKRICDWIRANYPCPTIEGVEG